uniref:Uncharacterized protein n=1 Tax=Arundo donax TaxID=35708 RepID=A0A0A9E1X4_ARUDO
MWPVRGQDHQEMLTMNHPPVTPRNVLMFGMHWLNRWIHC